MIRFFCREVYMGHVIHGGGYPACTLKSIDGDVAELERWLSDLPRDTVRELMGIEVIPDEQEWKAE